MRALLFFLFLGVFSMMGCAGVRPSNLGVRDGRLAPCPSTPNCVSSQSNDREHFIEPLPYAGDPREAMARLKTIIQNLPRTAIIDETGHYIHAEFTSLIFRFVDDVEFFSDDGARFIQVRSASRLGTSDFGVNRKRVEAIRKAWNATP